MKIVGVDQIIYGKKCIRLKIKKKVKFDCIQNVYWEQKLGVIKVYKYFFCWVKCDGPKPVQRVLCEIGKPL